MAQDEGIVQSVDRALTLLELMASPDDARRLSDLARRSGLAVSTTHRLLTTLERRGFALHDPQSGSWTVGQRANLVGDSFSLHGSLVVPARPILRDLRDLTRETANLGVIEAEEAVTVAQSESREIMRAIAPPGGRVPVLNSGMGKAIVATWPDAAIDTLIERQGLRPLTSHSLRSKDDVFAEIHRIRVQGFALDDEEYVIGMRCVAAPVWSEMSEAIAAVSVSGLAARLTRDHVPAIAKQVVDKAAQLTKAIGGQAATL
ncbi:transcriptional regulator, IclR family [Epibacterium ulvae]|uniref:Transcriptional regulator, IclR family n=1 Tax=Epibacterium ulvae TaxID=1156985 RepID=A0A1G5RAD1_9RHOB|nr:IclR family transcriptional regulator [Epibacterium ulvae]SCZ71052.1 transcriptional regulator, IclR family [Epibacterium ulvae]